MSRDGGSASRLGDGADTEYAADDVVAGKYRLVRELGKGGMGSVWLASNTALDVEVALKLLRRSGGSSEGAERLLREARSAAKLGHPSIVRVFDFGRTERGDPFIVMEMLKGTPLRNVLYGKGRLDALEAARTLLPVASALVAAHARGIVHRDLKPDNVILCTDDTQRQTPKVVDFGIAKLRIEDVERTATAEGAILGSPDYMSPEQAAGRLDVDHTTDIWSFCVTLYECVTGDRPFGGHNYNALLASIRDDTPAPLTDFAAGDNELWQLVLRGLSKARADRWPAMRDLGCALASWAAARGANTDITGTSLDAEWLGDARSQLPAPIVVPDVGVRSTTGGRSGTRFRTDGRSHPSSRWWPALVAAGATVVGLGVWWVTRSPASGPPQPAAAEVPSATPAGHVEPAPSAPPPSASVAPPASTSPAPTALAPRPAGAAPPLRRPAASASGTPKSPESNLPDMGF